MTDQNGGNIEKDLKFLAKTKYFFSWKNDHIGYYQFKLYDCSYCDIYISKRLDLLKTNHRKWYQFPICGFRLWKI